MEQQPYIPSTFTGNKQAILPLPESPLENHLHIDMAPHDAITEPFAEAAREPGDIEGFLSQNQFLFSYVEYCWYHVQKATDAIVSLMDSGYIPVMDPFTNKATFKKMPEGMLSRDHKKFLDGQVITSSYIPSVIRSIREYMTPEKIEAAADSMENKLPETLTGISQRAIQDIADEQKKWDSDDSEDDSDLELPDEIEAATHDVYAAYSAAFGAQHLALRRLAAFLEEKPDIMAFVERIQNTIELRRNGIVDFPGLLETTAALIAKQQAQKGTAQLEQAIIAARHDITPLEDFIDRVFTEGPHGIHGNQSKEFFANIAGAKLVAESAAISLGGQAIDIATIKKSVTHYIQTAAGGPTWQAAYEADATAQAANIWRSLHTGLLQYEKRGRSPEEPVKQTPTREARGKRKKSTRNLARTSDHELTQIIQQTDTTKRPQLAILHGVGGNTQRYGVEPIDTLDELLEHDVVTRFLRKYQNKPNLADTVRSYMDFLLQSPTSIHATTMLKQMPYRIADEAFNPHRTRFMRRFRPHSQINGSDGQGNRTRVLYDIVPSASKTNFLLIHSVLLREPNSY